MTHRRRFVKGIQSPICTKEELFTLLGALIVSADCRFRYFPTNKAQILIHQTGVVVVRRITQAEIQQGPVFSSSRNYVFLTHCEYRPLNKSAMMNSCSIRMYSLGRSGLKNNNHPGVPNRTKRDLCPHFVGYRMGRNHDSTIEEHQKSADSKNSELIKAGSGFFAGGETL